MRSSSQGVVCSLALIASILATFIPKLTLKGDAEEYIVQTQALALFGTLSIPVEKIAPYWNETNPFGQLLKAEPLKCSELEERCQASKRFGSLYPDRYSNLRYIHSPAYSIAVAPIYWILHQLDSSHRLEYYSFRIFNLALFLLPLLVAFCSPQVLIALFSPLIVYLSWQHPEVFQWSMVTLSFLAASSQNIKLKQFSSIFVGVAAAQNFPILAFLLPLWFLDSSKNNAKKFAVYGLAVLLGLSSSIYFLLTFGVFSPIESLGHASSKFASFNKVLSMLFSPSIGALWCWPGALVGIFLLCRHYSLKFAVSLLLIICALLFLMSGMANMNSALAGSVRYMTWIFAPLYGVILRTRIKGSAAIAALGTTLVWFLLLSGIRITHDEGAPALVFSTAAETPLKRWYPLGLCLEDPEVLYERITGRELVRPYEFELPVHLEYGESTLWVVPKRGLRGRGKIEIPANVDSQVTTCPNQELQIDADGKISIEREDQILWQSHSVLGGYVYILLKKS